MKRIVMATCLGVAASGAIPVSPAVSAASAVTAATVRAVNGRIAYVSEQGGRPEIWVMGPNGQHQHRLLVSPTADVRPAWSPDGTRIAFVRTDTTAHGGDTEIWIVRADGTHAHAITRDSVPDEDPAWSPDGKRIAYTHGVGGSARVWVKTLATGRARNVSPSYETREPAWRPGANAIAVSARPGDAAHYVLEEIRLATGAVAPLATVNGLDLRNAAWAPDGSAIATEVVNRPQMVTHRTVPALESVTKDIRVLDPTGQTIRYEWSGFDPAWSPDGRRVAYGYQESDGPWDVSVRDLAGSVAVGLTPYGGASEYEPSWQRLPRIVCPRPIVKGKAKVGKRLHVVQGALHPALTRARFTWLRGKHRIDVGRHHKVTRKDVGKRIRVRARCSVVGATAPVVVTSKKTKKVHR